MEIRFFQPEDTESLADLLQEMSRHYNGDDASAREIVERNLLDNILGPDSDVRIVVAIADHCVIGVAMISIMYPAPKERAQLFMNELYVASDHRSQGVGKRLMDWIAKYAIAKNCVRFDWTVGINNHRAIAFYRSLGASPAPDKLFFRVAGDELLRFAGRAI
jgi:GNAT superfamily N-acetyltransferase